MSENTKPSTGNRAEYGRAEFDHLWRAIDPFGLVATDVDLHRAWHSVVRIDNAGVWLDRTRLHSLSEGERAPASLDWSPYQELNAVEGRPLPLSAPLLSFPFDAQRLAAFLVDGVGEWLRRALMVEHSDHPFDWGEWGAAPDAEKLNLLGDAGIEVQEVVRGAWESMRNATSYVGAWGATAAKMKVAVDKAAVASAKARKPPSKVRRQSALATSDAWKIANAFRDEWRRNVVRQLLTRAPTGEALSSGTNMSTPPRLRMSDDQLLERFRQLGGQLDARGNVAGKRGALNRLAGEDIRTRQTLKDTLLRANRARQQPMTRMASQLIKRG